MSQTLLFAQALLSRASITPQDEGCQELINQRLRNLGFKIQDLSCQGVRNTWARYGTEDPIFCFAGHTDVVETGDRNTWHSPPFEPTIRDGRLYARGAADMKSSIAAMVTACERFLNNSAPLKGSIAFLITSDEEGQALHGTKAALEKLHAQGEIPQWCLVGEASSEHKLADVIKIGRRGSLTGKLKIRGKQGHVAYPQLAKNPIHVAFAPLQEIATYPWADEHPPFPATTLQFAQIQAGHGSNNVIPSELNALFNLRFSPHYTAEVLKEKIESILQKHGCDYGLAWHQSGKPFLTPMHSEFVQKIANTIEKTCGYSPILSTAGGTSDGRFFAEYGTHVVEVGPNNASIHQINEFIDLAELEQLSQLYEAILNDLLS